MRPSELLRTSWGKFTYHDKDAGTYCIVGAFSECTGLNYKTVEGVFRSHHLEIPDWLPEDDITNWNDRGGRMPSEIVELAEKAEGWPEFEGRFQV